MKHKRILVAVSMLLLSAVLLSSASFAWFSMNTDVAVDGIEFEAYSDSLFLEISADNSTFLPDDLTLEDTRKALRPVAYGYLADILGDDGKAYTVVATEVTADNVYYDGTTHYYERQLKADTNDTKVAGTVYDYICVDEKLESASSVENYYVLGSGNDDLRFAPVTVNNYVGNVYRKVNNDFEFVTNPNTAESATLDTLGLYYVSNAGQELGATKAEANKVYYKLVNNDYVMVNGLNAGSRVKGLYTLQATEISATTDRQVYLVNSDGDYIAFNAKTIAGTGLDGYWYTGYSENINPSLIDGDAKNISGIIGNMNAKDSPYVLYDTIYLRMAEGAADAKNLVITNVDVQGSDDANALTDAVRVIFIATSTNGGEIARILYNQETGKFTNLGTNVKNNLIDATLTGNTAEVITVDMYVYYDGTHSSVATHENLLLSGHKISVGFEIDLPDYAK